MKVKDEEAADDTDDSSGEGGGPPGSAPPVAVAVAVPSAPPLETFGRRSTSSESDEEAEATAAEARERGVSTIRDHCERHLSNNPDSSYVTWIATLHPENAEVAIDPRFLIEGNPWLAVYAEAKENLLKGSASEDEEVVVTPETVPPGTCERAEEAKSTRFVGLIDFLVGSTLVLISVSASFVFELAASYCYVSYWLCSKIVDLCSPPSVFTWLPIVCIAFVLGKIFQVLDTVLLIGSIIFVECTAIANYILCTIFACSHERGKAVHQTTRKMPHLVRWAIRRTFEGWDPPREYSGLARNICISKVATKVRRECPTRGSAAGDSIPQKQWYEV